MKKLILIALIPALLFSCKTQNEKSKETEKKQETEEQSDVKASTLTKVGQQVPAFSFETVEGEQYTMSELEGKVVLLNFFATWCPSCMKEMPALQDQVWNQYKDKDDFFMVSVGREHNVQEMKEFQEKKGYTFNFAPDTGRVIYGQFAEKYIPRNVLVDKGGKIIYQCAGFKEKDFNELLGMIEKKLE